MVCNYVNQPYIEFQHMRTRIPVGQRSPRLLHRRNMSFRQRLLHSFGEYCDSTSIHGLAYLKSSQTFIEKLLWALIIITCFTLAGLLIFAHFKDSDENPILTNIETISVQELPFPAVTINADPLSRHDSWRYVSKILNGLKFDNYFEGEYPESNELADQLSNILGLIVDILVDNFQPSEDFLEELRKKDPNFNQTMQDIAELYANHNESLINQEFESMSKRLLLLKPKGELNTHILLGGEIMKLFQEYPLAENHSDASESDMTKAKTMGSLPLYVTLRRGGILGFGDFLSYFEDDDNLYESITSFLNYALNDQLLGGNEAARSVLNLVNRFHYGSYIFNSGNEDCPQNFEKNQCHNTTAVPNKWQNCCKLYHPDLKELLFAMRESIQPTKFFSDEFEIKDRKDVIAKSEFENILDQPKLLEEMIAHNYDSRIHTCKYNDGSHYDNRRNDTRFKCDKFRLSMTYAGLGYTFNAADFWAIYKSQGYTDVFSEVMRPQGYAPSDKIGPLHPREVGKAKNLFMILRTTQMAIFEHPVEHFIISTHSPFNIPNVLEGFGIKIEAGTSTMITVTPTVYEANENLKSIPIEKRNCRFEFENSLKLFQNYSMDGCIFECLIESAFEGTNCIPWDYPHMNISQQTCKSGARFKFQALMRNGENQLKCEQQCMRECNSIEYIPSVSSLPLEYPRLTCTGDIPYFDDDSLEHIYGIRGRGMIKVFEKIMKNETFGCNTKAFSKIAIVEVQLASNQVTKIITSKRVSFTDHIANLGKIENMQNNATFFKYLHF